VIPADEMDHIRRLVEEYWKAQVQTPEFVRIAAGKEIGHKIGDMVDEQTTALLKATGRYTILHQHKDGVAASRSMGDFWMEAGGVFNPVNIKAGEYGKNGQPNLVSLKRVLSALAECVIDSYYLLIMKIRHTGTEYSPHVYLVDMLDFLEYTVFNSGPGQMMLKEAQFYPAVDALYAKGLYAPTPGRTVPEKIDTLFSMLERADVQLLIDREKKRTRVKEQVFRYSAMATPSIIKQKQKEYFALG
jgi:hypothetical protein